jgi:PAS domain S-box-containing protein
MDDLAARIVTATAAAVVFADRDGVVRIWNRGAEQLLGYPAGEAIGRRVDLIVPPEYHELHWAGFDRAIATGSPKNPGDDVTLPAIHRSGERVVIHGSFNVVHDDAGDALGVAGVFRRAPG